MKNFNHFPRIKTLAFNHLGSSCYDNEKKIYDKMQNEMFNHFGTRCFYYIVDYNTNRDKIFGEDTDRHILRKFPTQVYFTLPQHEDLVSLYGIEEMDNFDMFISKIQLSAASTLDHTDSFGDTSGTFPMYAPLEGDLLRPDYSEQIYEILHINDTEEQFLQTQHTWKLTVRKYKDIHLSVSAGYTSATTEITPFMDQDDMFDISTFLETQKGDVLVSGVDNGIMYETLTVSDQDYGITTSATFEAPNIRNEFDPFGGW